MGLNLSNIIEQVGKEKGLNREVLIGVIESAMERAAIKKFGQCKDIEGHYNEEAGEVELFMFKTVVKDISDPDTEISVKEAQQLDPESIIGDSLGVKLDPEDFGRIDAQTVRQIIIQKLREAERNAVYSEYNHKVGHLVSGMVRKFERGDIIVELEMGRAEAVLPSNQQVRRERYRQGDRLRAIITDVKKESRGPQVVLSRISVHFLNKLFESEVPEVYEGIVEIKSAAREAGDRSKIAVCSNDQAVDPVGACVGVRGSRVQIVVQELRGEKIDIIPWSDEPALFAKNSLSPAQISTVVVDDEMKSMEVVVPTDQLSLAIGKRGQNVRLASKLIGWNIDIKSESEASGSAISPDEALRREVKAAVEREKSIRLEGTEDAANISISSLKGVGAKTGAILTAAGLLTLSDLAGSSVEELASLNGIAEKKASNLIELAREELTDSH